MSRRTEKGGDGVGVVVRRLQCGQIDLVILDGTMPKMSGRDTLIQLIKVNPNVRVLFSSGYSPEHHQLAEFAQVAGYVNKPYRGDELAAKVRETLDKCRLLPKSDLSWTGSENL